MRERIRALRLALLGAALYRFSGIAVDIFTVTGHVADLQCHRVNGLQHLQPFPTEIALVAMPNCAGGRPTDSGQGPKMPRPAPNGREPRGLSGGIGRRRGLALPRNVAAQSARRAGSTPA